MRKADATDVARPQRVQSAIRLAVVDDHPAVRAGLRLMLAGEPEIEVVATAATAAEAYEKLERERPDLTIVDYHLPGEDGLSLCYRLKSLPAPPLVLILSAFADDALAVMAAVAGANGLINKGAPTDLCEAVAALARGETLLPDISPDVMEVCGSKLDPEDLPILGMLIHGVPADDIAGTLGVERPWLAVRRWGMLERLRDRPPRRAGGVPRATSVAAGARKQDRATQTLTSQAWGRRSRG
jgi:DNA-binding NarL/FixJ family response regulator